MPSLAHTRFNGNPVPPNISTCVKPSNKSISGTLSGNTSAAFPALRTPRRHGSPDHRNVRLSFVIPPAGPYPGRRGLSVIAMASALAPLGHKRAPFFDFVKGA